MIWKVNTFGGLRLFYQNQTLGVHLSRTSKALIGMLAARQGRSIPRDEVTELLWSADYDKASQHRLSTILWRLRNLGDIGGQAASQRLVVIEPSGDIRINDCNVVNVDLAEFESAVVRCRIRRDEASPEDVAVLTRSADLYTADFLRDIDLEWVSEKRQYLRQCHLDILQFLIECHSHHCNYDEVIDYAGRFLRIEPYLETVHVFMIKACLATGRRSMAAARAEACRHAFMDELGVAVGPDTQLLLSSLASATKAHIRMPTKHRVERGVGGGVDGTGLVQLKQACSQLVDVCSSLLLDANDAKPSPTANKSSPLRKSAEQ
ncbi:MULTISPECIES: AfsR/SARP family transcriptional regulator [Mesorhizobium]|uniref:DNA-binding transcriptional activator of the SARP family n=1 Tax=Mesorhizobium qingshengii TaxID=1165689 RepID=A0A1G5ZX88_9HYPH|nr:MULTISPECIES: BTAD domain-containing putative transcriptional regulator [Mesorhizobium]AID34842.1 hypothetical protein MCHK_8257 [Mesorhizobium huakuii 7653R]MCH4560994.1 hypothetical protein [Mesorhizobium jarvisii]SDA99282.1 DNA-binding transcriptional activator of the SARP family [Mesorhizobium qingshengii]